MSVNPRLLFGRRVIYTDVEEITAENIVDVLNQAISVHEQNRPEIDYLYSVYKGNQDILYKVKEIRSEICNKIPVNFANEIVTFKTGYLLGKPIQYVSRGEKTSELSDEVSSWIDELNRYSSDCDKPAEDVELAEWFHICGTAYRIITRQRDADNESPFEIHTLDPRSAFTVYSTGVGHRRMLGVQITNRNDGTKVYNCYSRDMYFKVIPSEALNPVVEKGRHYLGRVPIIEYPANNARLGAFEIVLPMLDAINAAFSDLADAREQFINAFMIIKGASIDADEFAKLKDLGALQVPADGDVNYLVSELNQTQNGETINLMIDTMLEIVGMPQRSGADTSDSSNGVAIVLRNGWSDAESRAADTEKIFKKSENEFLRIALRICNAKRNMNLRLSSVEPHFTRQNTDNLLAKVQALMSMLSSDKVHPLLAWQLSALVSDPESAYMLSREYEESRIEQEQEQLDDDTDPTNDNDPAHDDAGAVVA